MSDTAILIGSTKEDIGILITEIPQRKKPCLLIRDGNGFVKAASFNNWDSANKFVETIERIFDTHDYS